MEIAIIGWGSLIWCPGSLQVKSSWHRDGPVLPVEYARISGDGRLTLVIDPTSEDQPTLWAVAVSGDMAKVRENLRQREGSTKSQFIHSGSATGWFSDGVAAEVRAAITKWLKQRTQIEACAWTGLPSNWKETQKSDFSVAAAVQYLQKLPDPTRAREYIQNTPGQIQTAVRRAAAKQLGWHDAALSPALFATN